MMTLTIGDGVSINMGSSSFDTALLDTTPPANSVDFALLSVMDVGSGNFEIITMTDTLWGMRDLDTQFEYYMSGNLPLDFSAMTITGEEVLDASDGLVFSLTMPPLDMMPLINSTMTEQQFIDATMASWSSERVTIHDGNVGNRLGGMDLADVLNGNGGSDVLRGFGGNDAMNGGTGNDRIFGDAGNDTMTWGATDLLFNGGAGTDTLKVAVAMLDLRTVNNTVIVGTERTNLTGGGANHLQLGVTDVLSMPSDTLYVYGDATGDMVHRGAGWTRNAGLDETTGGINYSAWTRNTTGGMATLFVEAGVDCVATYMP